jgi:hypothetical protein
MMRTLLSLKPGKKGTKQLLAQYGDRLLCVRYRYDPELRKRFKTVELVVAECHWVPRRPRFYADQVVGVRIGFAERALRERAKQAGARWNSDQKVWQMRYSQAVALGLVNRIQTEDGIQSWIPGDRVEHLDVDTARHLPTDAGIHRWMLAYSAGCHAVQSNYSWADPRDARERFTGLRCPTATFDGDSDHLPVP